MGGSDGGCLNGHLSGACLVYERSEFRVAENRAFAITGAYGVCAVCGAVRGIISCGKAIAEEVFLNEQVEHVGDGKINHVEQVEHVEVGWR